jgi:phosphate transport system substrate-binding protein
MAKDRAAKIEGGIVQIPLATGAVVIAYNLPGVDGLGLSREAVSGIFLGEIQRWNHPLIQAVNKDIELPDIPITLVARADSSGTSFVMTRHLSAVSPLFGTTIGSTMTPVWPKILKERGALIRGKGKGGCRLHQGPTWRHWIHPVLLCPPYQPADGLPAKPGW